jgi:uncharacterized repeat protein (TIGR03899 family)
MSDYEGINRMTDKSVSLVNLDGLSEPLAKLVEAIRSGCGVLYEPTQIRRRAKADADASLIKMKADLAIRDLAARAEERVKAKELRRQQNIESIVEQAAHFLPETVSSEKVDPDWIVQFFQFSQDIGNEELQSLWAKLLAGEVAQPGSYSLRTLQTVKLLRKEDAELFTKLCSYTWQTGEDLKMCAYLYTENVKDMLELKGLNLATFLHLENAGLLNVVESGFYFKNQSLKFFYFGKEHIFYPSIYEPPIRAYLLTAAGNELAPICGAERDDEYRICLIESLESIGITTEVIEE